MWHHAYSRRREYLDCCSRIKEHCIQDIENCITFAVPAPRQVVLSFCVQDPLASLTLVGLRRAVSCNRGVSKA